MEIFFHNPIANLPGIAFLIFYGIVMFITIAVARTRIRDADLTGREPPPPVPARPDPYELAYLRGGGEHVTRLATFELVENGYLGVQDDPKAKKNPPQQLVRRFPSPSTADLHPIEREVLQAIEGDAPVAPTKLFESQRLANVHWHCEPFRERLQREQLLAPLSVLQTANQMTQYASVLVVGLGIYRFIVAQVHHHTDIIFLVIVGVVGGLVTIGNCRPPRLSQRGEAYLRQLEIAYGNAPLRTPWRDRTEIVETSPSLLLAVMGIQALTAPQHAYVGKMFKRESNGGGGCGGCGGGGCGGGCGGCGA